MKKNLFVAALVATLLTACQDTRSPQTDSSSDGLSLLTEANPAWEYENLRLYPIVLTGNTAGGAAAGSLKTLKEAMDMPGFRITERKRFGRSPDAIISALTVQNRGADTIFLMSGDVITGGNQDRVIAHDELIAPNSVRNVEVFCVEPHRWSYFDSTASEQERQVAAFRGYYNVASPEVRRAVQRTGQQQEVWAAVGRVTEANGAKSSTGAYAALESENDQKNRREAYLHFFDGKFAERSDIVGIVAVYNGEVRAVDIFAHPELFRRQFPALLHGYVVEAATAVQTAPAATDAIAQAAFLSVAQLARPDARGNDEAGKFSIDGEWVHLFRK